MHRPSGRPLSTLEYLHGRSVLDTSPSLTARYRDGRLSTEGLSLFKKDLVGHFGCVNAIEFSNMGGQYIASGGDDRRVLLWNTQKSLNNVGSPVAMAGLHNSNIFCLALDSNNDKIFSGGNDEQVIVHDVHTKQMIDVFPHKDAIYGLAVDPINDYVFASACDDGRILIYDIRAPPSEDPFELANYVSPMHTVTYNPVDSRLIATANAREGIALWDVRKPRTCLQSYGGRMSSQSCMSVRFNYRGDQLLALRRRLPPILYSVHQNVNALIEFQHEGYYNSCTMKSCSFAGGRDQYVMSGSDDFNIYIWQIPEVFEQPSLGVQSQAHIVLKGHRSIANQVRYSVDNDLIISSGVEKIIKVWSPFNIELTAEQAPHEPAIDEPSHNDILRPSRGYSDYINLVLANRHDTTENSNQHTTDEDPNMIAFFDSLVRRDQGDASSTEGNFFGESDDDDLADAVNVEFVFSDSSDDTSSVVFIPDRGGGAEGARNGDNDDSERPSTSGAGLPRSASASSSSPLDTAEDLDDTERYRATLHRAVSRARRQVEELRRKTSSLRGMVTLSNELTGAASVRDDARANSSSSSDDDDDNSSSSSSSSSSNSNNSTSKSSSSSNSNSNSSNDSDSSNDVQNGVDNGNQTDEITPPHSSPNEQLLSAITTTTTPLFTLGAQTNLATDENFDSLDVRRFEKFPSCSSSSPFDATNNDHRPRNGCHPVLFTHEENPVSLTRGENLASSQHGENPSSSTRGETHASLNGDAAKTDNLKKCKESLGRLKRLRSNAINDDEELFVAIKKPSYTAYSVTQTTDIIDTSNAATEASVITNSHDIVGPSVSGSDLDIIVNDSDSPRLDVVTSRGIVGLCDASDTTSVDVFLFNADPVAVNGQILPDRSAAIGQILPESSGVIGQILPEHSDQYDLSNNGILPSSRANARRTFASISSEDDFVANARTCAVAADEIEAFEVTKKDDLGDR